MDIFHCQVNIKDLTGLLLLSLVYGVCIWDFVSSCFTGQASFGFRVPSLFGSTLTRIIGYRVGKGRILYYLIMGLNLSFILLFSYYAIFPLFSQSVFDELTRGIFICQSQ